MYPAVLSRDFIKNIGFIKFHLILCKNKLPRSLIQTPKNTIRFFLVLKKLPNRGAERQVQGKVPDWSRNKLKDSNQ